MIYSYFPIAYFIIFIFLKLLYYYCLHCLHIEQHQQNQCIQDKQSIVYIVYLCFHKHKKKCKMKKSCKIFFLYRLLYYFYYYKLKTMEFTIQEIEKIKTVLTSKLETRHFTFQDVTLSLSGNKLSMQFTNITHPVFKNVKILSYNSYVKESVLYTYVYIILRFKYNNRTSPSIGHNLTKFRIALYDTEALANIDKNDSLAISKAINNSNNFSL